MSAQDANQDDANQDIENLRRRARYRAWHRGMLEMDMILGPFADAHTGGYDREQLQILEVLMDEADADLLSWIMGRTVPGPDVDASLIAKLTAFQLTRIPQKQ